MLRCAIAALAAFLALHLPAGAQQLRRNFPDGALRGEIVVVQPPEIALNGRVARLAPGARIRGADNMLLLSGSVVGQRMLVNYTLDPHGLVKDVWVLRDDEASKPWPRSPEEAAKWSFDSIEQVWTKQ